MKKCFKTTGNNPKTVGVAPLGDPKNNQGKNKFLGGKKYEH